MQILSDLLKILLPAGVVLYAMYLTVRTFLSKEIERKNIDIKVRNSEIVLPIRLQAYERMCLFLERISPNNLILRLNNNLYTAAELHQVLLSDIREEYGHNLSQQVYMSDEAWSMTRMAMDEVVAFINSASGEVPAEARSVELAKMIFELIIQSNADPTGKALRFIKDEIRQSF